jgi:hypothetical protein
MIQVIRSRTKEDMPLDLPKSFPSFPSSSFHQDRCPTFSCFIGGLGLVSCSLRKKMSTLTFGTGLPSPVFNLENTLGVSEISTFVLLALFGFTTMQTYHYFQNCDHDKFAFKASILSIWLANLVVCAGSCYRVFVDTVTAGSVQEQISKLGGIPLLPAISVLFGVLTVRLVQGLLTYRVHLFSRSIPLTIFACTLCIMSTVGGIITAVRAIESRNSILGFREQNTGLLSTTLALEAITDIYLTIAICWFLRKRQCVGSQRTSSQLDALVIRSIESGVVTSVLDLVTAFCVSLSFLSITLPVQEFL